MPLGEIQGIHPGSEVIALGTPLQAPVGDSLMGRVIDALGKPAATERLKSFLGDVAARDRAALEMASAHSGYQRWRDGVEFQADLASLRLRRIVDDSLVRENRPARAGSVRLPN